MCYNKFPIEGYMHVYKEEYTTTNPYNPHKVEYKNGVVRETLEELYDATCGRYEYDCTTHKHLVIAKIKIELVEE